jgi:hypothetical protein
VGVHPLVLKSLSCLLLYFGVEKVWSLLHIPEPSSSDWRCTSFGDPPGLTALTVFWKSGS